MNYLLYPMQACTFIHGINRTLTLTLKAVLSTKENAFYFFFKKLFSVPSHCSHSPIFSRDFRDSHALIEPMICNGGGNLGKAGLNYVPRGAEWGGGGSPTQRYPD